VIDLAAGTGKLTRMLLGTGAALVAVEPVAEMRALIEGVEAFDGRADAMPFPEGWADAVTVGQAFHWFANEESLREIHRVLKPAGALGLIWNLRDLDDPLQRTIEELISSLAARLAERHEAGTWRAALERSELFGALEEASFPSEQRLDADGLVARFLSMSYVATAPEATQRELERKLRELAGGEVVRLPYVTRSFVTRKA
jgi:ubiquinone/menaquinone biosynthesis C-methylase UbiE